MQSSWASAASAGMRRVTTGRSFGAMLRVSLLCIGGLVLANYFLSGLMGIAFGILICFAGAGLLSFAIGYEVIWWYRKKYWIYQEGSVVGKVNDLESCYPIISYSHDGRKAEFTSKYDNVFVEIGRLCHVYHCAVCMEAEEHDPKRRLIYSIFTGTIGIMLITMGLTQLFP